MELGDVSYPGAEHAGWYSPAATKLLILFLKLANFSVLVSPLIPGDASPSHDLIWPLAKLRVRSEESQTSSYLLVTAHGDSPVGKASTLPPFSLVFLPFSAILCSHFIAQAR